MGTPEPVGPGLDLARFESSMFAEPDPFFGPVYDWMWNDVLTVETIASQLDAMHAQGARGTWALPVPKEHRPGGNPTNLQPEYLTDGFLEVFRQYLLEAKKRDMRVWLYDEGGWPSGSVCGRVVRENPELVQQYLQREEVRPWAFTESFAVYGSGLTLGQMKWITDFQYVRGTNLLIPSGVYLSARDHYMAANTRPNFDATNPLSRFVSSHNRYAARLSYLLSLGKPAVDVAVYYPLRDMFAGGRGVEAVGESQDRLAETLLRNQCDFDLIDDDVLERSTTQVRDGALRTGAVEYRTVCVSRTKWMKAASKRKLEELEQSGGRVVWVDSDHAEAIGFEQLRDCVEPLARVEPACSAIRVCARTLTNGRLYFVTNEDPTTGKSRRITFPCRETPLRLDPDADADSDPEEEEGQGGGSP